MQKGKTYFESPDTQELPLPLESFNRGSRSRSPSNYALAEIEPAIAEQTARMKNVQQSKAAQAAFAMMTGDFTALSDDVWTQHDKELASSQTLLHRLQTEPWRRWANGFSCLCFLLVGAAVAIQLRFSEFIASFFICFLPILVVYYPLMAVSVDQAKDGAMPPQAVWLGNFVLAIAGAWLLRRVVRY
jgi:lipopolysaccharide export system permease protein